MLPPYYLAGVTEAGIEAFFRAILARSQLPVLLYNFPANTNSLVSPEMYMRLAKDYPLLRGIKNTFADIPLATKFKQAALSKNPAALQKLEVRLFLLSKSKLKSRRRT